MPTQRESLPESLPPTPGGLSVTRRRRAVAPAEARAALLRTLDRRRGLLLECGVDYPGRYRRGALGFADPPLLLELRGDRLGLRALGPRGRPLLLAAADALGIAAEAECAELRLPAPAPPACEEERTRGAPLFAALRRLLSALALPEDALLGFHGAFGYDLVGQLEPQPRRLRRAEDQRDLVLYLPDRIFRFDPEAGTAERLDYDFAYGGLSSAGLPRGGEDSLPAPASGEAESCDHEPGAYAAAVSAVRGRFRRGELYECVLSQRFERACGEAPSRIYARLAAANPAPYAALINLGEGEFLVSASPEMFVRVRGGRVETCPISGTVARGADALEDAERIRALLGSAKEEAELTMCTDVDRNDKSRVCLPGSVRVIGRRQIELYSRLIHTVDHVEGRLRPDRDALDAFLTHAWAVTVTGAPKPAAIRHIEATERSARRWYGGAFGRLLLNGDLDSGLTLRTLRLAGGRAEIRVGATLLWDSEPELEELECRLKASALVSALAPAETRPPAVPAARLRGGLGRRVLVVDHEDSFVLLLADYLRQTGADVRTLRHAEARAALCRDRPDLVLLSPGPGRPADFGLDATIALARRRGIPLFGVCLGLQGLVEHFGGALLTAEAPTHGKPSRLLRESDDPLFEGLAFPLTVGRYHSLRADPARLPDALEVLARSEDGAVMALRHRREPIRAVQFHPESILSQRDAAGLRLLDNAVRLLTGAEVAA